MLHLFDRATMAHALTLPLDPRLHRLLRERIDAYGDDLLDQTEFLIVGAGDSEDDIQRHIGFSPLIEPIDGIRFGEPGFYPHWDWLARHDGWYEMIVTFGSTFAYVLFIEADPTDTGALQRLCDAHAN